jgi:hypothetical protein
MHRRIDQAKWHSIVSHLRMVFTARSVFDARSGTWIRYRLIHKIILALIIHTLAFVFASLGRSDLQNHGLKMPNARSYLSIFAPLNCLLILDKELNERYKF